MPLATHGENTTAQQEALQKQWQSTWIPERKYNYMKEQCSELFINLGNYSSKSEDQSSRESKYLQIVVKTLVKQK